MIALVRHAKAGERGRRNDHLRPLTGSGAAQARALVAQLESLPLAKVLTSPYLRCRQTVEPLASSRGIELEESPLLAEGASAGGALDLMAGLAKEGAALCSHGDVIQGVLLELVERGLLAPARARAAKGSTWLIEFSGSEPARASYLEAP